MTFVVAMFAATVALVWFGYVATREWRSGTNLLLERRANEALALVRATLSADMKGAWITAIVPFNTTDLDEDPPYSMFQVAARTFAQFPYPESFVLWKHTGREDGDDLRVQPRGSPAAVGDAALVGRPVPGRAGPRPARAGRTRCGRPEACDGGVAVHHAGAADRRDAVPDRRARALRVRPVPRTPGIHGLHGQ